MNWPVRSGSRRSRSATAIAGVVLFGVAALAMVVRASQSRAGRRVIDGPLARLQAWTRSVAHRVRTLGTERALPATAGGVALETEPRIGSAALDPKAQTPALRPGAPQIESEPRSGVKL